jgi:hypothetical protein
MPIFLAMLRGVSFSLDTYLSKTRRIFVNQTRVLSGTQTHAHAHIHTRRSRGAQQSKARLLPTLPMTEGNVAKGGRSTAGRMRYGERV